MTDLLLLRFRSLRPADADAVVKAMRSGFEARPEVRQVRVLTHTAGGDGIDFLGLAEAWVPLPTHFDPTPFGAMADALDLVGAYTPF